MDGLNCSPPDWLLAVVFMEPCRMLTGVSFPTRNSITEYPHPVTLLPPRPQDWGSTDTGSLQRESNHGEGGELCHGSIVYVSPLLVTPTASPSSSSSPFRVHGASEAEKEGRRRLGVSTGPCPKVPARWPSVQRGLPRPAGEGSMKAEPGKGGDPAKRCSAGSSKHMPLPHPADTRMHACAHST